MDGEVYSFFLLIHLDPSTSMEGPWKLEDWRARIIADLEDAYDPIHGSDLCRVALLLGGTERIPSKVLSDLDDWTTSGQGEEDTECIPLLARLTQGDVTALEEPDGQMRLRRSAEDLSSFSIDWARLLVNAKDPKIQQVLFRMLEENHGAFHPGFASLLDQAFARGNLPPSPSLERKMSKILDEDAAKSTPSPGLVSRILQHLPAILVGLFLLVSLVSFYRIASPPSVEAGPAHSGFFPPRIRPACNLVITGVLLTAFSIGYGDVDWVFPYVLGFMIAALGASLLAKAARGWPRLITPAAWIAATVLVLMSAFHLEAEMLRTLAVIAQGIGLIALPLLSDALRKAAPSRIPQPLSGCYLLYFLSYGLLVILMHWGWLVSKVTGEWPEIMPGGWIHALLMGWLIGVGFIMLIWALWDLRKSCKAVFA
jgi:hypothetical protein